MTSQRLFKVTVLSSIWAILTLSQTSLSAPHQDGISDYLKRFATEYNRGQRSGGIPVNFTGDFTELPDNLNTALLRAFPNHRFVVANMLYFHYTWYPGLHLILVTDKATGNVTSYAWDLWFNGVSDSFRDLLSLYPSKTDGDALSKVKVLSELLVFPTNGCIGKLENKNGLISCELYIRSDEPWRVLRVRRDGQIHFGRTALINPKNGK
jgi:hypothetical protein